MLLDDIKKTVIITKSGLYHWNVMPFELKNVIGMFSKTMAEVFKDWTNQFLKVFVDDVNIHSQTWEEHLTHLKVILT
jgi:beta-glucosidase/6-phospho-beta-glucosidase/beta-galactosidase